MIIRVITHSDETGANSYEDYDDYEEEMYD